MEALVTGRWRLRWRSSASSPKTKRRSPLVSSLQPTHLSICSLKACFPYPFTSFCTLQHGTRSRSWSKCNCSSGNHKRNTNIQQLFKDFSKLSSDWPWDSGSVWTTMGTYFFLLHIPLSLGGLSIISRFLHQELDPQTKAVSLLFTQTFELVGGVLLIQSTCKSFTPSKSFKWFLANVWGERGWLKASLAGISIIYLAVLLTSTIAQMIESKSVNNAELEQILSSSVVARLSCFIVYCFITPILEEVVYRGFLLTSLTMYMEWPLAMILSSCAFSIAHFSLENAVQIFFIGCILGSAYIWSRNLMSSFVIHCIYNVSILVAIISS